VAAAQPVKRKLLINLALLLLVAVLGLIVWLEPGPREEPLSLLTERQPETVLRLGIEHPDGRRLRFERAAADAPWFMLEPYALPANGTRLAALARVVEAPILNAFPLPGERLADFGLEQPIRLLLDDTLFEFGGNDPINHHRYVKSGGRLTLIVDRFYHHLSASAEQLVSPALLPPQAAIQSVRTPDYQLSHGEGGWRLEPPNPALGGDDLSRRVADWVNAQGLAVSALVRPQGERAVEIVLGDGQSLRFLILQQGGKTWLVRPDLGVGYQIPEGSPLLAPPKPKAPDA
jgi:hypothetical protein